MTAAYARLARLVREAEHAQEWGAFAVRAARGFLVRQGAGDIRRAAYWRRAARLAFRRAERKRERAITQTGRV